MAFKKEQIPWNKGKKLSAKHRRKLSESHKGQTSWNKGIPMKEESKRKLSDAKKGKMIGEEHPFYGKTHSEESKRKMSDAQKRRYSNPEERKRMNKFQFKKGQVAWNKGKIMSKEIRQKMHRITIVDMQELAKIRGGKCLSNEYRGSGNNLKWMCERGHEWKSTPHNIKKGTWCPTCSTRIGENICRCYFEVFFKEKFPKKYPKWLKGSKGKNLELDGYCKKLNLAFEYQGEQHHKPNHYFNRSFSLEKIKKHDEFKKQKCKERGVTLIQVPYHTDYKKLGEWIEKECKNKGFNFKITFNEIDYKVFDIYSSKNLEEMQEIAKNRKGKCLSKNYINNFTKLIWQCEKNHSWRARPSAIKKGTWCPTCSIERAKYFWNNQFGTASEFQENELNNLKKIAKTKDGELLSKRYVNAKTKLEWRCKKGHEWKTSPDNIKLGKWCPTCSYEYRGSLRRGNIEEMRKIAESRGGKCLSEHYVNVDTRLRWQCKKGHIWEAVPSSIKRGSWCARCVRRKQK